KCSHIIMIKTGGIAIMHFGLLNKKRFTAVFIATMIFAMIGSLLLNPVVFAAGGGGPAVPDSVPALDVEEKSEDGSEFDPPASETKPDVAAVPVDNQTNRIITTLNGDTASEMGFSSYISDRFEHAKVSASKTGEFDDVLAFDAEAKEAASSYGERHEN